MQASDEALRTLLYPLALLSSIQGLFPGSLSLHDGKGSQLLQAHSKPVSNLSGKRVSFSK